MTAIVTTKYIRKPLYVDAVKITPDNFSAVALWCQGEIRNLEDDGVVTDVKVDPTTSYVRVRVHNPKNPRQTQLRIGDWLLYTDRGYKVYTEKAFFNSFEEVPREEIEHQVNVGQGVLAPEPYQPGEDAADIGEIQQ